VSHTALNVLKANSKYFQPIRWLLPIKIKWIMKPDMNDWWWWS